MVVRRENDGIRRYVHLATGNYNGKTARVYTGAVVYLRVMMNMVTMHLASSI